MKTDNDILELLERNNKLTPAQIGVMLNKEETYVSASIKDYEKHKVILGYKTLINWEKTNKDSVTALIEVKVTPQRGEGFDKIAERIYLYPEVTSCYLMSGGFDLTVVIEGKTLKEVALFVAEKLSTLESVQSTATHFILKKYKDEGTIFENRIVDDREAIIL
ncbi:MAG TPA: Lrp/AsnC family transcriptional regulator [Clostridiaceae bacterium]